MSSSEASLLLVDDDPAAIQLMSRMLSRYPEQRFATSGADALRLARELTPDLILLDADMPGMTGFNVYDALKTDPTLARVPVIFATSYDTPVVELAALERGAADFVTKPLVASQLNARVRAQLHAQALIRELKRNRLAAGSQAQRRVSQTPRLLVVDDDVAAIHMLRHTLADMGDFHFAKSGQEALDLARRLEPDLVLLDFHMPDVDGFEVCETLKAEPLFAHVPIVFVTRFSDPQHELRAFELGAADFIAKPYTTAVLRARVRNLLELKQRTDTELEAISEHWRQVGDARVADIVGAASDGIVTYDAEERLVLVNAAACRLFGVQLDQALGHPARSLLGAAFDAIDGGATNARSIGLTRHDGSAMAVEVSHSTLGTGAERLCTVVLRDVSDRERLQLESRARAEAETANRTKTMMVSYLAHELGNPLNGLLGFAQLMQRDAAHPLGAEQARRLARVLECGQQLQELLRDMLDIGRFETGHLRVEPRAVDASSCVARAADAVSAMAAQQGIELRCVAAADVMVLADADRLHQCLVNSGAGSCFTIHLPLAAT